MKKLLFLLVLIVAGFTACTKLNDPDNFHGLISISLSDTLNMFTGQVRYVPIVTNPVSYNPDSLSYVSSDTSVLSFSNVYKLTAKKPGTATITISNLTKTISVNCLVTVTPAPIDSLKLGLVAYYPFNNSVADSSGNHYNGIGHNLTSTTDRFGHADAAYYFGGDNSYVIVPETYDLRLNGTDFTLSGWVKLASYTNPSIFAKRISGANNGWQWSITGSTGPDPVGLLSYGPGGGSINAFGKSVVTLNEWHMMTSTYNIETQTFRIYVDGALDSETTGVLAANAAITTNFYIGRDDPSIPSDHMFQGVMDDMRIYNRELNAAEILKLYTLTN